MEESHTQAPADFIPTNIVNATSKVQAYYILESTAGAYKKEFFDLEHVRAFSSVGLKSALHDSVIWALGYVLLGGIAYFIQDNYLTVQTMQIYHWTVKSSPLFWFTKTASFGYLVVSTGCCVYMSRFYTGVVSKRAINTLFMSRGLFLITFAIVTFFVLGMLNKYLFNEENLLEAFRLVYRMNADFGERLYLFLSGYFRRSLFESAIVSLLASFLSVTLPILSMLYFRYKKRKKEVLGIKVS
ncbi:MAG: hypothetical protein M0Z71_00170 [Nitrospiraceae bacterium]|nr:hypothetical protein [Nitrospiraceae bacterium]